MAMNADSRTAVVTGANRGLGLHLVEVLMHHGWHVMAGCRHPDDAGMLYALRPHLLARLDVTDSESVEHFAAEVAKHCDGVDLLVNNAGVMHAGGGRVGEGSPADLAANGRLQDLDGDAVTQVLRVNTVGPLLVTQAIAPLMRRAGKVVNVSSRLGSMGYGTAATYAYSASKAALNMATVIMAKELAPRGIICVSMSPGWVRTDMGGPNARLDPLDSATGILRTVEALTPEQSGQFLDLDGHPIPW
jgi:NAD(P)-dependent dehydrogenase (short-subunit alcohol dehydrogenase family)